MIEIIVTAIILIVAIIILIKSFKDKANGKCDCSNGCDGKCPGCSSNLNMKLNEIEKKEKTKI